MSKMFGLFAASHSGYSKLIAVTEASDVHDAAIRLNAASNQEVPSNYQTKMLIDMPVPVAGDAKWIYVDFGGSCPRSRSQMRSAAALAIAGSLRTNFERLNVFFQEADKFFVAEVPFVS